MKDYLQSILYKEIPLTQSMGIEVFVANEEQVILRAPLAKNINHKGTAFGGSLYSVMTLTGWSMANVLLKSADISAEVVIQDASIEYLLPVVSDFESVCLAPDFSRFLLAVKKRKRGRLRLIVEIKIAERVAVRFHGSYVAEV